MENGKVEIPLEGDLQNKPNKKESKKTEKKKMDDIEKKSEETRVQATNDDSIVSKSNN